MVHPRTEVPSNRGRPVIYLGTVLLREIKIIHPHCGVGEYCFLKFINHHYTLFTIRGNRKPLFLFLFRLIFSRHMPRDFNPLVPAFFSLRTRPFLLRTRPLLLRIRTRRLRICSLILRSCHLIFSFFLLVYRILIFRVFHI